MCWLCEKTDGWAQTGYCEEYRHGNHFPGKSGTYRGFHIGGGLHDANAADNIPFWKYVKARLLYAFRTHQYEGEEVYCSECYKANKCPVCAGSGEAYYHPADDVETCRRCGGSGKREE